MSTTEIDKRPRGVESVDELRHKFPEIPENEVRELLKRSSSREECLEELSRISERYLYGTPKQLDQRNSLTLMPNINGSDYEPRKFNGTTRVSDSGRSSQSSRNSSPDRLFQRNESVFSSGPSAGVTPDHPAPHHGFGRSTSAQVLSHLAHSKDLRPVNNSAGVMMHHSPHSNSFFADPATVTSAACNGFDAAGVLSPHLYQIAYQNNGHLVTVPETNSFHMTPIVKADIIPGAVPYASPTYAALYRHTNAAGSDLSASVQAGTLGEIPCAIGQRNSGDISHNMPYNFHHLSDSSPVVAPERANYVLPHHTANWHAIAARSAGMPQLAGEADVENERYMTALLYHQTMSLNRLKDEVNVKLDMRQSLLTEVAHLREQIKQYRRGSGTDVEPKAADVQRLKTENEDLRRRCQLLVRQQELLSDPGPAPPRPPAYRPPQSPPQPQQQPQQAAAAAEDEEQQWSCTKCSLLNHPLMDRCECCETPRVHVRVAR